MTQSPSYRAGAAINTSVFVALSADDTVTTAGAGVQAVGISHEGTADTPIPGADGDVAIKSGESGRIYGLGETCEVRVGTGGLTAGDFVKPDANGAGVVAASTEKYSARCLSGGAASGRAKVVIEHGVA